MTWWYSTFSGDPPLTFFFASVAEVDARYRVTDGAPSQGDSPVVTMGQPASTAFRYFAVVDISDVPLNAVDVNLRFRFHDFGGTAPHAAKLFFKNGDGGGITNSSNGLADIEPFMSASVDLALRDTDGNVNVDISQNVMAARAAGIDNLCIVLALAQEGVPGTGHDIGSIETISGGSPIVMGSFTVS